MSKGFSLISLVIAMAIFLGLAVSAQSFFSCVFNSVYRLEKELKDFICLDNKMGELNALSFEDLPAFNGQSFAQGQGTINIIRIFPDLLEIRLEFRPIIGGKQQNLVMWKDRYSGQ